MIVKKVMVNNESGLHARPATNFINFIKKFECDIHIEKDGEKINARSIIALLTMGISKGSEVEISTSGVDEEVAMVEVVDFIEALQD